MQKHNCKTRKLCGTPFNFIGLIMFISTAFAFFFGFMASNTHDEYSENPTYRSSPGKRRNELEMIMNAKVHLKSLSIRKSSLDSNNGQYSGVTGTFCTIRWEKHKKDPGSGEDVSRLVLY